MPTLKKEWFQRPNRMTHRFGEPDDPLMPGGAQTFSVPKPNGIKSVNRNGAGSLQIRDHGLHVYTEPFSPVDKAKGGVASFSGPTRDMPDEMAENMPVSTQMRRTQGPAWPRKQTKKGG